MEHFFSRFRLKTSQRALELKVFQDFALRTMELIDESPESFWKCHDALKELALSRAALDYIEHELLGGLNSPQYMPQLELLECDSFRLNMRLLSPASTTNTINSSAENRMMAIVHGSILLHRFEQLRVEPIDVLDQNRQLVSRGSSVLEVGDVIKCRAGIDCHQISDSGTTILFEMHSAPVYSFQWSYDSATLIPKRVLYTNSVDMRAQLGLLTVLNLQSRESVPDVLPFLNHPNYFIRWCALKTLIQLQPEKASAYLEDAMLDGHPQIKAAAVQLKSKGENTAGGDIHGAHSKN
jgi:hypothetical protein